MVPEMREEPWVRLPTETPGKDWLIKGLNESGAAVNTGVCDRKGQVTEVKPYLREKEATSPSYANGGNSSLRKKCNESR